jgi:hypothetical protein
MIMIKTKYLPMTSEGTIEIDALFWREERWNIEFDALFWREERWNIEFDALFWREERWNIEIDALFWREEWGSIEKIDALFWREEWGSIIRVNQVNTSMMSYSPIKLMFSYDETNSVPCLNSISSSFRIPNPEE